MKNLIKAKASLPAKAEKKTAPANRDFDQALAVLRKSSGRAEYRLVPCRCAIHDRPFVIVYSRTDPRERFRIHQIRKEPPQSSNAGGMIGRFLAGANDKLATYDFADFDSSGRKCPWCDARGSFVHCEDCGETYCNGTVRQDTQGRRIYNCVPRCGSQGELYSYDKMHGKRGAPQQPRQNADLRLTNGSSKKALPPPTRPLLPKRK